MALAGEGRLSRHSPFRTPTTRVTVAYPDHGSGTEISTSAPLDHSPAMLPYLLTDRVHMNIGHFCVPNTKMRYDRPRLSYNVLILYGQIESLFLSVKSDKGKSSVHAFDSPKPVDNEASNRIHIFPTNFD